jgi:purine-binding chemotaxis protein CheW
MEDDLNKTQYLMFRVGCEYYAFDIARIQEVLKDFQMCDVPGATRYIKGILNLRGHLVTILSGGFLLCGQEDEVCNTQRILILAGEEEWVGIHVDEVCRVLRLTPEEIEPPLNLDSGALDKSVIGSYRLDSNVLTFLDLQSILEIPLHDSESLVAGKQKKGH